MRLSSMRWSRRRLGLAIGALAIGLSLAAAGSVATLAVSSSTEAARLRDKLQTDLDEALVAQSELGARDATIAELRTRIATLEGEIESLNGSLTAEVEARSVDQAEIDRLSQQIAESGVANGELADLQQRYDDLLEQFGTLQDGYDEATRRLAQLVPIESTELAAPALYLDEGLTHVATTRPLCSGSMEPTITCDDLLVLYEPESPTDLDEGDVIYFKKPNASCTGTLDGRFTLHRIVNVVSNQDGLFFQTKGDAFVNPDYCMVPAENVVFKLLTTIRNGRVVQ